MKIIQNNPYRIAGILSNATERELQKQKTKNKAYTKVGKEIKSEFDFKFLDDIVRTEDSVNQAFSKIEQNQDKVNYSLFWFLNVSPFDNTAIEYLKNGDEKKAIEIWKKVTTNKDVNSKNFSAFNNLGTYKLLGPNKADIKLGIEAKIKLIESEYFKNFVHSVADETYTIDNIKQSEKLIDELLIQFKNRYSNSEILQLFNGCNGTTQKYLSKKLTEEPLNKIESQIENCKKKRKADKSNAYEFGLKLFKNTKDDLSILKLLLGTNNLKYKAIADQLANEIMQCGIDYFNESQENNFSEDYLEKAQKLTKLADSIAVGKLTKDRVKDSLASLEDMKDREMNQAIAVLQSIKGLYEKNEYEIYKMIAEKGIPVERINIFKLTEMIENSINWDKVTELLIDAIPRKNILKIRNVKNESKIKKYKVLVKFVLDKIDYSNKRKIQYLEYWQTTRRSSHSISQTTSSSSSTSTYQSSGNEFSFSKNAWWILGIAGIIFGLILDFGWGSLVTGFIGLIISTKFTD